MRHVVALSGGKDSTAMALRLRELNPEVSYEFICTPVGNEPPELFDHLDRMEALLGTKLIRIGPVFNSENKVTGYCENAGTEDGLIDLIRRQQMIPNFRARFCTRQLKIEPTVLWLQDHAPCVQYVGLRADEGERAGIYGYMANVTQAYPFREWGWGESDVLGYLADRGVKVPWRTNCTLCYHQKLVEWWQSNRKDRAGIEKGLAIEAELGHTFRSPGRDTWPVSLVELTTKFDEGRRPKGAGDLLQKRLANCDMDETCRVCSL